MVACALAGFADDSNQTVAATSYTSVPNTDMPRRRMLLAAGNTNRKSYTYYGSSSSNSGNSNTTMIFVETPPDIIVDSAKIIMRLHYTRIDEPDFVPPSTSPTVSFNGVSLGHMTKLTSKTQNDEFTISPSLIKFNDYNTLWHGGTVNDNGVGSWASITIEGVVKTIDLKASQNYDDRIQLTWNASSGLSGARYFIDRRQNPDKPFKCINEDEPILGSRYDDMDASAGGNYYYRVRSESGVMSEQVIGKRVAKTVEPKLQFTLNGIIPSQEGLSGEKDILVAGNSFSCTITNSEPNSVVMIKNVKLIGLPVSGTPARNRHEIECFAQTQTNGSLAPTVPRPEGTDNWVKGSVISSTDHAFKFSAKLRTGPGLHGKYNWRIECKYEINGVTRPSKTIFGETRNVYFIKKGKDNGTIPNWYAYWKEDGACPGLTNENVRYASGRSDISGSADGSYAYINDAGLYVTPNAMFDIQRMMLKRHDVPKCFFGIYNVEATVAHEIQHNKTSKHYDSQIKMGKRDQDKSEYECAVKTGYGLCVFYRENDRFEKCDHIVDDDEDNGVVVEVGDQSITILDLNKTKVDTFNLRNIIGQEGEKWWDYGGYGDDELISRIAECLGADNARPQNDWAYPGELAGDLPNEVLMSPSYHKTRSLKSTSSELQSNTNLIISVNSIKANAHRNPDNCITGIVYTIGVSVQGDECVWFRGSLFDFHGNTVATASAVARAELDSVEMFFDARDIFENSNGGPYTLGKVELTVDDNYSTNNVIGVLYDFAVDPIEVNKDELLCNKGHIIDTVINELSETGVVATVSTKINIADGYLVSAELVSTNDELVAFTSVSNLCVVGTNMFRLAFSSDAIYQNGVSGICAVKNVKLWQNDELIDADATGAELSSIYDCSDFVPSNVSIAVDLDSGRFIEPSMTTDGKLSSLRFVFDVTNGTGATIGYDVAAVLMGTNSALVASINTLVYVTNGVNQIELSIPASDIAASGEDGPYRFESIELQPQGDSTCGTTYRPNVLSGVYGANDFGGATVEACDSVRLIETSDYDVLTFEYSYNVFRVGRVIVEIVLTDRNGDLATNVITTNEVSEIGVKTNVISIARCDFVENNAGVPYAVASLSLHPDILGEEPVYVDTTSLTNIFWQVAPPVFSPVTKTVFFSHSQPVVISCATPGAEIRYTLDGSEPTYASTLYNGSLAVTNSAIMKAKAFADSMRPSETAVAEYVHAALVGDNLVQDDSMAAGEVQALRIPAPGTYKVSFDYSQGGDIELRLSQNGTTNTLAVISASSAGSTNFLFEIAGAGDYELSVCEPLSGETQPADVSSLNICITDTGRNRSRYWIYETENTFGSTGEWVTESGFVNGKMPIVGHSAFTAARQSSGRNVTILTTFEADSPSTGDFSDDQIEVLKRAKCAITIGQHENGTLAFQVLSIEDGQMVWLDVGGIGIPEPTLETPYTFKITIDCTNRTSEVALVGSGGVETPLSHGETNRFAFVAQTDNTVRRVMYYGGGNVISLWGIDNSPEDAFIQGDTLPLDGNQIPAITEGEAAWLNSMNSYDVVRAKVASMARQDLEEAYLLNLDITQDVFGLDVFKVSGIEVTETEVKIHVWLNRTNAIQTNDVGGKRDAPINGMLKLYGGTTPQTKELLNTTMVTDANFAEGDTATIIYPQSGGMKFFRPVIEAQ